MDRPHTNTAARHHAASRRWFLNQCGVGLGAIAARSLLAEPAFAGSAGARGTIAKTAAFSPVPGNVAPHFAPKAKRVIFLSMGGAPSHLELFDPKPQLTRLDGTLPPKSLLEGYRAAFINPNSKLLGSRYGYRRYGKSGVELSELLPHTGSIVDKLAIVRSMKTDAFNHAPAQILLTTGSTQFGRPSAGAWVSYGLGTENRDLPGFVVMLSGAKGPSGGSATWGAGFLPTMHQGVQFRGGGDPILFLSNPKGVDGETQRDSLATLRTLNQHRLDLVGDPEIATRINSFELAFRMQSSAPEVVDLARESKEVLDLYGAEPGKASFANNCLLACRLVEKGVRFVQLHHEAWDHHGGLTAGLKEQCALTDRASAALVKDLERRGLLDETLVIWGGEFGRTPMVQGGSDGRDHHPNAFTMWMAGGGVKPGTVLGATDDLGFNIVESPVHVNDLHATILHLLGFDHERLTFSSQGRDFRLTDVAGKVVRKLVA